MDYIDYKLRTVLQGGVAWILGFSAVTFVPIAISDSADAASAKRTLDRLAESGVPDPTAEGMLAYARELRSIPASFEDATAFAGARGLNDIGARIEAAAAFADPDERSAVEHYLSIETAAVTEAHDALQHAVPSSYAFTAGFGVALSVATAWSLAAAVKNYRRYRAEKRRVGA